MAAMAGNHPMTVPTMAPVEIRCPRAIRFEWSLSMADYREATAKPMTRNKATTPAMTRAFSYFVKKPSALASTA